MRNYIKCPRCEDEQDSEQTYCNKCGINMQKYLFELDKEGDEK